jgi:hypothetical protein
MMAPVTPPSMVTAGGGDGCPSCGATMAADQRYCLECGQRRGDPRLPFMDAVVFMDALRQPAVASVGQRAQRERGARVSAGTSLVAGVATLVLAIGVGVLIGRGGDGGSAPVANATPQVIRVEGAGGATETAATTAGSGASKSKAGAKTKGKAKEKAETGSSGTSKAAEEVLKPAGDVKLPPPTTQVGGKCDEGTAGCSDSGEFDGNFFGE